MNPKEKSAWLIDQIEKIYQKVEEWKNEEVKATISLTDRDFDRHGTSSVHFSFVLKSFAVRTSGARMMFFGTAQELIEIVAGFLEEIEISENKLIFLEHLEDKWYRKTILFRKAKLSATEQNVS